MNPGAVMVDLWIGWAISWFAAAAWSNRTEKRVGVRGELVYRTITIAGAVLLATRAHSEGPLRLWHIGWTAAWICVALELLGFAFCWWARLHLGRLWSGTVTLKADHHVVDTGPYALVRHPIYTGIILALLATAAAKGTVLGLAGTALLISGFFMKARLEERWLRTQLGPEAYDAYRKRVPMLVPFLPR